MCLFVFPTVGSAEELIGPDIGTIPFGMGRAYSAVADDWLALHYNPAGIALFEGVDLKLLSLRLGANKGIYDKYESFQSLSSGGNDAALLSALAGTNVNGSLNLLSQLTIPHFAVAMVYDRSLAFDSQNAIYPFTKIKDETDFSVITGFGFGLGKFRKNIKPLRIGFSIRFTKRKGGTKELDIAEVGADTSALLSLFNQSGWGMGGTLGLQFQLPFKTRSEYVLSMVYHDIGKVTFGDRTLTDRPTRDDGNLTIGMMMRFPIGGKANRRVARRRGNPRASSALVLAFDYSHLNISTDEEHFPKHIHLGLNLDLPIISIQLGVNQTSFTSGFVFALGVVNIGFSTFAEEVGSYAGQKRDRRYFFSLSTGLGFGKL